MSSALAFRRIWPLGLFALSVGLSGCGLSLAPPGFVREHRHAVCRGWFDWNSHRRFSVTFETYDQLPPHSARVKLFRWSHGGSVDQPRAIAWDEYGEAFPEGSYLPQTPGERNGNQPPSSGLDGNDSGSQSPEHSPPLAPPSDLEPFELPWSEDPQEHTDEPSASIARDDLNSPPLVSIGFTEDLMEADDANSTHGASCSLPRP